MSLTEAHGTQRPRVEGDREQEILAATLEILTEVGFDKLTMDAVAARAKASKATLYRRWENKASLVIEALHSTKEEPPLVDTGSLRGDLMAAFCGMGGLADPDTVATFASTITAICRDPEFAETFRNEVVGPKLQRSRTIWERARERGEIRKQVDLDLLEPALAGIVLHRVFVLGQQPDENLIARVIDQIILPAAGVEPPATTAGATAPASSAADVTSDAGVTSSTPKDN
jgi:AcrR family transcriptional regulator